MAILLRRTRLQERCADVCCHHASINSENQEPMPTPSGDQGNISYHFAVTTGALKYWRYRETGPFVNAATQRSFSTTPSPINDSLHPTQTRDCYLWNDDRLQITQSLAAHVESPVPTFAALHRITRATWSDVRNLAMGNLSLDYHLWATCLRNYREIVATAALRGLAHTTLHHQP
jgi:hypothetical protein